MDVNINATFYLQTSESSEKKKIVASKSQVNSGLNIKISVI